MTFFEPPAPVEEPEFRYPEHGPWFEPPKLTSAGILPMNRVLARTDHGAVVLTEIRAYPTGCWWEIAAAVRRPATQVARRRIWNTMAGVAADSDPLPPELLRFGVHYGDGTTATTLRRVPATIEDGVAPPEPPVLYPRPQHGGSPGGAGSSCTWRCGCGRSPRPRRSSWCWSIR